MYLSRAFDYIPYTLFRAKPHTYILSINPSERMTSYYCNRNQRVKLGNSIIYIGVCVCVGARARMCVC